MIIDHQCWLQFNFFLDEAHLGGGGGGGGGVIQFVANWRDWSMLFSKPINAVLYDRLPQIIPALEGLYNGTLLEWQLIGLRTKDWHKHNAIELFQFEQSFLNLSKCKGGTKANK